MPHINTLSRLGLFSNPLSEFVEKFCRDELLADIKFVLGRDLTAEEAIRFAEVAIKGRPDHE